MNRWLNFYLRCQLAIHMYGALVIVAAAFLAMAICIKVAFAHDGWKWIAENRNYVDRNGVHCCSEDCSPARASDFIEEQDGIRYKNGQKVYHGNPDGMRGGIYWSQEPDPPTSQRWWICVRNGRVNCIFRPQDGS